MSLEQRVQPVANPNAEQNQCPHLNKEFSAHSGLIWVIKQYSVQDLYPVLLPYQGREVNSQPCLLLSMVLSPYHLVNLTRQSRQLQSLSCSLTWVRKQVISAIQLFLARGIPPSLEPEQLPHPKIDHNSRYHQPKNMTSRQTQTELTGEDRSVPTQTCKVQKRSLITQMHRQQYKESRITRNKVYMTSRKEMNKAPITNPREMKIWELSKNSK